MVSPYIGVQIPLIASALNGVALAQRSPAPPQHSEPEVVAPKSWTDVGLSDWATPLAHVDLRPSNFSEAELNQVPVYELYRSYPAYYPGREPPGYWKWLQTRKPELLIDTAKLRSQADWTNAGQRVFREMYTPPPEPQDKLIEVVRSRQALDSAGVYPNPDGTIPPRWVVTPGGIRIAPAGCQACHSRVLGDGTRVDGIPIVNDQGAVLARLRKALDVRPNSDDETARLQKQYLRQFGVPWLKDDIHERFTAMRLEDFQELEATLRDVFSRDDGSPFYPVKIPDLIGVKDRKYIDHTATHRHRGVEDLMRYATLITCCFSGGIGPERRYAVADGLPSYRFSDDVMYALALYIYSLTPPPNPNPSDQTAARGAQVFAREGCATCHTPPLYTNNKLTLAYGFKPPVNHPNRSDIMPFSVGTDPGTALRTRKGTGFYKVPSLRGVWYRGRYGHDGSVISLEEWFNPARLKSDYVPNGWKGYGVVQRAVAGHEFGLRLPQDERVALIGFLKTL
jgi:hypothetical protein